MALHDDLLKHARLLATVDIALPSADSLLQVNLRRAISSAYYALFHLLISESVASMLSASPAGLRERVSRAFTHSEMNRVCASFAKQQLTDELRALLPNGVPIELKTVARLFCQLQQERHSADYDVAYTTIRSFAFARIKEAEEAFAAWATIKNTEEANVFLAAPAFSARWSK